MNPLGALPNEEEFNRMRGTLLSRISERSRKRTRNHRIAAVGVFGLAATVVTAGTIAIASASPQVQNSTATCYSSIAEPKDSDLVVTVSLASELNGPKALNPLEDRVWLARELCGLEWQQGAFNGEKGLSDGQEPNSAVPPLVVCQNLDRTLAVYPEQRSAEAVCRELGLVTPRE